MYPFEETVNQYLQKMNITIAKPFSDVPGTNPVHRFTLIKHLNLNIGIAIISDQYIYPFASLGYVPKQNIAPLLRRLLNLNSKMGGPYFYIDDAGGIQLSIMRKQEGLDYSEFKWMLDQLGGMFWQFAAGIIQEFQLPQQSM